MKRIINELKSPRNNTRDLSLNIFVTVLLANLFALINPNFIDKYNLISIGQNLAPYAMLALGVLMPISMGGTDLSIGAVMIGSAVVAGKLYGIGMPLWTCIPVMLAFGTLIGCINGFLVSKYKMQPFIVTLGTMMFVRGATAIFASSATVLFPTGCWYNKLFSSYNGFPISFLWIILFATIIYFVYRKTVIGRYLISIGSGEAATRISGVDVDKYKIIGYAGAGLMAGVAGIFWTSSFATVTVATGNGMELDAIASVYIGGTSASGGLANVFGCLIGSLMLVIIRSGLNFALAKLNVPVNSTYVTYVISGIIVIIAVLAEISKNNRKAKNVNSDYQAKKSLIMYFMSIVLCATLVLIGLSGKNVTKDETIDAEKTIAVLMKSEGSAFWDAVSAGCDQAGEDYGYGVLYRGCENEDPSQLPKQLEILNTLMSSNPKGIGVSTLADGFTELIEQCYERDIKVIQYDSGLYQNDRDKLAESAKNPLASYVKASNYDNAALAAEKVFAIVKDDIVNQDEYIVGIIQHENTDNSAQRSIGFSDRFIELAQNDSLTKDKVKVEIQIKQSAANNQYKEALEYLYEKNVDFIFMSAENVTNQIADAINTADGKYDGIKFACYDTGVKAKEWMSDIDCKSPLIGAVSQNPYMIGYLTVETLINLSEGKEVDTEIIVPGEWFSAENVDQMN